MTVLPDTHDEGKLRSENAVLRSALETADARLAQAQTELEAASVQVKALQRRVSECNQIVASGEAERKALAAQVQELQAWIVPVPVDALRRQYSIGDYKLMSTQDYAADAINIARWLRSLDGDA